MEYTDAELELGGLANGRDEQWFNKALEGPVRFVNDEVVSCPRELNRRKALRVLGEAGVEEYLADMGTNLAAYVLERMCNGIETGTFKDIPGGVRKALEQASWCRVDPIKSEYEQ